MINPVASTAAYQKNPVAQAPCPAGPVFCMEADPEGRIDGTMPMWISNPTAKDLAAMQPAAGGGSTNTQGPKPFCFHDLLNMVNPLQHIPLVENLYRYVTGDAIQPESQVMGDAIYGGIVGGAMSLANIVMKSATGYDAAGHASRLAFGDKTSSPISAAGDPVEPAVRTNDAIADSDSSASSMPKPLLQLASLSPFSVY